MESAIQLEREQQRKKRNILQVYTYSSLQKCGKDLVTMDYEDY